MHYYSDKTQAMYSYQPWTLNSALSSS